MKPYYDHAGITIYHGDCREIMPRLTADVVVTDPPYGVGIATWDSEWLPWIGAIAVAPVVALLPGTKNLWRLGETFGGLPYRWTLACVLPTPAQSPIGFAHWHPVVIYADRSVSLMRRTTDGGACRRVADQSTEHPSPKSLAMMAWVLCRLPPGTILDPFMGSGTTLRAAKDLGRRAIGIEIEEKYCEIAAKRLSQESLFTVNQKDSTPKQGKAVNSGSNEIGELWPTKENG
jgi:site-specific DNA-methyltransferase (adenine-specific)